MSKTTDTKSIWAIRLAAGLIIPSAITFADSKFTAPNPVMQDQLGAHVSMYGSNAVASIPGDYYNYATGQVYILEKQGFNWVNTQIVEINDPVDYVFGLQGPVAIYGDSFVVCGQPPIFDSIFDGSAFVFTRQGNKWVQTHKLSPVTDLPVKFGDSVAMNERYIAVGSSIWDEDNYGITEGTVHIFEYDGSQWSESQVLHASDASGGDSFGAAVALSGNTLLVGAPGNDFSSFNPNFNTGAVYVYKRINGIWTETQILKNNNFQATEYFGSSIAMCGAFALIGAPGRDVPGTDSGGAVFVFRCSGGLIPNCTWKEEQMLTASDGLPNANFGYSIAMNAGTAIIGSPFYPNAGQSYIFARQSAVWSEKKKLAAPGGPQAGNADYFGYAAAINAGNVAIIGAPGANIATATWAGAVYLFDKIPSQGGACPTFFNPIPLP